MLATAGPLPRGEGWAYEVKWDGYRVLAAVENGRTTLRSRTGRDATNDYPEVELDLPDALVDGEVVALVDGRPDFSALQLHSTPVTFVPFDLLHLQDRSLLELGYDNRRALLSELLPSTPPAFDDGPLLLETTRAQGLEGVVAKRRDSRYFPGRRTESWVKTKHVRRQSAVVVGWKRGEGGRAGTLGSLLLGIPGPSGLGFVGHVGTGFSRPTLAMLQERLAPLARTTPPVLDPPREGAEWVEPVLVVDVEYTSWTPDGKLRHPSYKGLRTDLLPEDVVRE
jgi:bifunctional non-homologous end joining protein LigD